jgi:hypothetical protein
MLCRSLFVLFYFSVVHCVVCSSLIYGLWLHVWYLQTFLSNHYMLKDNGNLQIRGDIIKQNTNVYGLMFLFIPDTTTSKGMFYILTASFINQSGGLRLERYICLYTEWDRYCLDWFCLFIYLWVLTFPLQQTTNDHSWQIDIHWEILNVICLCIYVCNYPGKMACH